jgi:hypothetical protein
MLILITGAVVLHSVQQTAKAVFCIVLHCTALCCNTCYTSCCEACLSVQMIAHTLGWADADSAYTGLEHSGICHYEMLVLVPMQLTAKQGFLFHPSCTHKHNNTHTWHQPSSRATL